MPCVTYIIIILYENVDTIPRAYMPAILNRAFLSPDISGFCMPMYGAIYVSIRVFKNIVPLTFASAEMNMKAITATK